jgi:hypothetical protein
MANWIVGGAHRRAASRMAFHALVLWLLLGGVKPLTNALGDDSAPPRQTVDGVALPDAGERKIAIRLPLVRDILGGLPEEASRAKIFSIACDRSNVKRWKAMMSKDQVDFSGYDYICSGPAGAEAMLLAVSGGRVSKVGLFYPYLTSDRSRSLLSPFQDAGENATATDDGFRVEVGGVRIRGFLSGSWQSQVEVTHALSLDQMKAGDSGVSTQNRSYFCFITVYVYPVDWYVKHHQLPKGIADAMLAAHLAKGMTKEQANLVVGSPGVVRTSEQENERRLYWDIKRKAQDGSESDVEIWATFVDGKVTRFEDVDAPLNP